MGTVITLCICFTYSIQNASWKVHIYKLLPVEMSGGQDWKAVHWVELFSDYALQPALVKEPLI